MPFPEPNPESMTPIAVSYCIDYRYDSSTAFFLKEIGYEMSYYIISNAGAALPLGYKKSCENNNCHCNKNTDCCPGLESMNTLKNSFVTNLEIALTLQPISVIYLINHQDCGAIRAFLPCSGYPASGQSNKAKEININAKILTHASKYVNEKFENMEIYLGLIDVNGTVADYDIITKKWIIIYVGEGTNQDGLWFGYNIDDIITVDHC